MFLKTPNIPLNYKKDFLRWILNHFSFQRFEVKWLLKYLFHNDMQLNNICFAEEIEGCPRGILLRMEGFRQVDFQFHKGNVKTNDVDKTYHDLRFVKNMPMYIQFDFSHKKYPYHYLLILEDHPYHQKEVLDLSKKTVRSSDRRKKINQLKKAIDVALDTYNQKDFLELTEQLKNLEGNL